MKNYVLKMNYNALLFISIILITLSSCEEKLVYKYQDRPQHIQCQGVDKALIHEALYSFQEDIAMYYKDPDMSIGTTNFYLNGYQNFIYNGFNKLADFKRIASPHTLQLMEMLRAEKHLWTTRDGDTQLNYTSDYMDCLFKGIKNADLNAKFQSLIKVNYLSPEVMATPMRTEVNNIVQDPNLALYVAFDAFYQHLLDIDFSESIK